MHIAGLTVTPTLTIMNDSKFVGDDVKMLCSWEHNDDDKVVFLYRRTVHKIEEARVREVTLKSSTSPDIGYNFTLTAMTELDSGFYWCDVKMGQLLFYTSRSEQLVVKGNIWI